MGAPPPGLITSPPASQRRMHRCHRTLMRDASVYRSARSSSYADSTPCAAAASTAVQSAARRLRTAASAVAPSSLAPAGDRSDGVCTAAGTVDDDVSAPTLSYVPLRFVGNRQERRQQARQRASARQHPNIDVEDRRQPSMLDGDCTTTTSPQRRIIVTA